jgi:hypothetical protein
MNTLITIFLFLYRLPFTVVFVITNTLKIAFLLAKNDDLTAQQKVDLVGFEMKKIKTELEKTNIMLLSYLFSTFIWVFIFIV